MQTPTNKPNKRNAHAANNPPLSPSQAQFLDFIQFHGVQCIADSLMRIHDMALYHSDIPIDEDEKYDLYTLKLVSENITKLQKE